MREKDPFLHLDNILSNSSGRFISNHCILSRDSGSLLRASCPVLIPSIQAGNRRALRTAVTDAHQRQTTDMGRHKERLAGPVLAFGSDMRAHAKEHGHSLLPLSFGGGG